MNKEIYYNLVKKDEVTWEWFYNSYVKLVRYWVNGFLRPYPEEDKENVIQTTFMKVFKGMPTYDPDRPLEPWLKVVTQNNCSDWYNYTFMNSVELTEDMSSTPDMIDLIDLEVTLESLPVKQQEVLELLLHGHSPADIAEIQEDNIRTVYSRIHRLRKRVMELC